MASIRPNIIKQDEISECLDFLYKEDNHLDERAYIQNKIMTPSVDGWPIHIIQNIMKPEIILCKYKQMNESSK